jgi:hypothetical protein
MEDLLAAAGLRKADVDRLGEAMRREELTEERITAFRAFSDAFAPALGSVVAALRALGAPPITERLKTIRSSVAKLRRGTARLSQVQDVVGCRFIVLSMRDQNYFLERISRDYPGWRVYDRRAEPAHGYRAVHVVATAGGLPVEIQIRTELQHMWAELSEAWDRLFEGVKYGQGPPEVLGFLGMVSRSVQTGEEIDMRFLDFVDVSRGWDAPTWRLYYEDRLAQQWTEETAWIRDALLDAGPTSEGRDSFIRTLRNQHTVWQTEVRETIQKMFPASSP